MANKSTICRTIFLEMECEGAWKFRNLTSLFINEGLVGAACISDPEVIHYFKSCINKKYRIFMDTEPLDISDTLISEMDTENNVQEV